MRTLPTHRAGVVVAATALVAFALSSCGGGSDNGDKSAEGGGTSGGEPAANAAVYQFDEAKVASDDDQTPYVTTETSILITPSDELKQAVPKDRPIAVEAYEVTTKAFSTGICRFDADVKYADGGEAALAKPDSPDDESDNHGATENLMDHLGMDIDPGTEADDDKILDAPPSDDDVAENATYVTKDNKHVTQTAECSDDNEDDQFSALFPYMDVAYPEEQEFAEAQIAMTNNGGQSGGEGTTTIIWGETDADLSANGKWQPPSDD